jgi:probable blue pigment (indigoidine) exporter
MPLLAFTAWQLMLGGAMIVPVALVAEGGPPLPTPTNVAGFAVIGLVGTALAFALWFRGVAALPASSVAFLGLLSPIVATAIGWAALGQSLTSLQLAGAVLVAASIVAGQRIAQRPPRPRAAPCLEQPMPGVSSAA